MAHIVAKPLSTRNIRNYAGFMRFMFGYGAHDPLNVLKMLEHDMLSLDEDFVFDIVENSDPQILGKEGLSIPAENKIILPENVYLGLHRGVGRANFTVCHEIFHYFFHANVSFARDTQEQLPPIYKRPEWQANTFAREFLVPITAIEPENNAHDIANLYGCSYQVAEIQLAKCKILKGVRPMVDNIKKH